MWVFILYFLCTEVCGEVDDVGTVKLMEGGDLDLHPGLNDLKGDVQILWTFESGGQSSRVAQMHHGNIYTHYDKRFADRVHLDQKTGALTITDIRTNESGLYKALIIIKTQISRQMFRVDVYVPVSVPAIRRRSFVSLNQCTGISEEAEMCVIICSVRNDRDVSISWYKGDELLNQSSSPEISVSLSLALELHSADPETYSCTAANPVSQKSVQIHTQEICSTQGDCEGHCGVTEALIRLVLSALVGIATIFFVAEHVKICSSQRRDAFSV